MSCLWVRICSNQYLHLRGLSNQDGVMKANKSAFRIYELDLLPFTAAIPRLRALFMLTPSNVNKDLKREIVVTFREEVGLSWLPFIWCLWHQLEVVTSGSSNEYLLCIGQCLRNLFYLYEKTSKKFRESRLLHKTVKIYEFQNKQAKPVKSCDTRLITHVVQSMTGFVVRFGVSTHHIENIISDTSKQHDKTTLEGMRQIVEADILMK